MFGDQWLLLTGSSVFLRTVEIALGNNAIGTRVRWVKGVGETVLGDKTVRDDPKNFSPDFTDSVDTPVSGLVESLVCRWVDSLILEVEAD